MHQSSAALLVFIAIVGLGSTSFAQAQLKKETAQQHLDRGSAFVREGEHGAALAEFMAAERIYPHPALESNIGRVYMAMGQHAEAVQWLEKCLDAPNKLDANELHRAERWLEAEKQRVGTIFVVTNVDGASIEVDHLEIGKSPITNPVRVDAGAHRITVVATGYAPKEEDLLVSGQAHVNKTIELVPWHGTLGRVMIESNLPEADVVVNGIVMARTPLLGSLKLLPGRYDIELRREGYAPASEHVELDPGESRSLRLDPKERADLLAVRGGTLVLRFSETHAMITVDGVSRGEYRGSLRLAPGLHHVRAERGGFAPVERDVMVISGKTTEQFIRFQPNPDTLVQYKEGIENKKSGGAVALVGGGFILGAALVGRSFFLERRQMDCNDTAASQFRCINDEVGVSASTVVIGLGASISLAGLGLVVSNWEARRYESKPHEPVLIGMSVKRLRDGFAANLAWSF